MSESFGRAQEHATPLDPAQGVDRRTLLRRGIKLAYVTPVIIMATRAEAPAVLPSPPPLPPLPPTVPGLPPPRV
jgi:hypothetical protein